VIFNNITRIKELEKNQNKMRGMFFSSMAHELRTPLNSIIPMCSALERYVQNSERGLEILKIIKNSSIHLQNLIEDSLDLSRI
jgi:signal transduction histidine kinase